MMISPQQFFVAFAVLAAFSRTLSFVNGCTNLIVTPGASKDTSMIMAYNGDGSDYFGMLYHYPASKGNKGKMRKIYDWMTGYVCMVVVLPKFFAFKGNICTLLPRTHFLLTCATFLIVLNTSIYIC
jgi:hypothetical protein